MEIMEIDEDHPSETIITKLQWFIFGGVLGLIFFIILIFIGGVYFSQHYCLFGSSGICNGTNQCIGWSKICDRFEDCPDGADEINCDCLETEYPCKEGRCISKLFLCDDIKDCPLGDDEAETNCVICKENEVRCKINNECIKKKQVCDNVNDCNSGSDESDCYFMKDNMSVRKFSGDLYVACADGWQDKWNQVVCTVSLKIKSNSVGHSTIDFPENYKMMKWKIVSLDKYKVEGIMSCNKALILNCEHLPCGQRPLFPVTQDFIIDGRQSEKGYFPWFATLIFRKHSLICGAGILSETILITAEHCVFYADRKTRIKLKDLSIQVGSHLFSQDNTFHNVAEIIFYQSNNSMTHDVILMRLSQPLEFSSFVQPACIDFYSHFLVHSYSVCVIVGHGKTTRKENSRKLLFQRIHVINYNFCKGVLNKGSPLNELCLSSFTKSSLCHGDSGGPLLCSYDSKVWFIAGINSYVYGFENKIFKWKSDLCKLSVAMKMSYYRDWVLKYLWQDRAFVGLNHSERMY